ncbi:hypothetical protein OHS33_36935 [Streptomyces sp. NBC_00536]|uniref:hypothetical protein n=1 Tax=Streptomyces sp. NBC_00536 TaxID=2975769 RepID=UPI002E8109B2|nr:hypothetical protein [Streptomyces sp. NBC_00536]WUC83456.1 hypothetical protein OHS33_36935 [Streptomyces sp. NBC_00536]
MNPTTTLLAGKLDTLGDSLIKTVTDWGGGALVAALIVLVLVTIARQMSMKAAIGAVIAMVIALGIYKARDGLADSVSDEINHPANGAGAVVVVIDEPRPGSGAVL